MNGAAEDVAADLLRLHQSEHAQRVTIRTVIDRPSTLSQLRELPEEEFTLPLLGRGLHGARECVRAGRAVDFFNVCEAAKFSNTERVEFSGILEESYREEDLSKHVEAIRTYAWRQSLAARLQSASNAALDGIGDEELSTRIRDLLTLATGSGGRELKADSVETILSNPVPRTPWAVPGLLACGDVGIVSGKGYSGKSLLLLSAGLSLATERPIFGHLRPVGRFRIAFLDLESRPWEIDQRLHRLAAGMEIEGEDIGDYFSVIRERLRLDVPGDVDRLIRSLEALGSHFLFVDSMRRCFAGDENDSAAVSSLFVTALDRIRAETGCGTILSDHTRKSNRDGTPDNPEEAMRGSSDKRNLADLHVAVERREERIAVIPTKARHSPSGSLEPFLVTLKGASDDEQGPLSIVYYGSLDRASDAAQDAVVALLTKAGAEGALREQIINASGYGERSVSNAIAALKNRGRIQPHTEGRKVRYTLTKATTATEESAVEGAS